MNVTTSGTIPSSVFAVKSALSAGGGAVTEIVRLLLLVVPPLPVTVSVTGKVPTLDRHNGQHGRTCAGGNRH